MKYKAFISYSHVDRKWAGWLHRALENYRPPKHLADKHGKVSARRLSPIFRDRDELPSTANLSEAVQQALEQSEALIVVCSPHAAASRWVNEEITTFRALGRASKIFCFLVDGNPSDPQAPACFPDALTEPDQPGGARLEPVAADARPVGDGRKNAMLKIAAGLLGVGFDDLQQRDLKRRNRRLVGLTAGSLVMMAITGLLAINAMIARDEARAQRAQAEDLIDFMLGDLREHLREIGRLDVFERVGDKALSYFAEQDSRNESVATLTLRARNMRQIGDVRMEQGNMPAALEAFLESLRLSEQIAAREPENPEAQIAMANSLFYVGYVHWKRGELSEARGIFESIVPVVRNVSERDPENPKWLIEEAYAQTNLGRVLELQGAYKKALAAYQGVMNVNRRLVVLEPDNPEWVLELGFAHNNLGKLFVALGQLDEAEAHYRSDLDIKKGFNENNLNHNVYRSYVAVSHYFLGQLLTGRGQYGEAGLHLQEARDHFLHLNVVDPERKGWLLRTANIERELASLAWLTGDSAASLAYLQSSVEILDTLSREDGNNAAWRRDLLRSLLHAAGASARQDLDREAREYWLRAAVQLDVLSEQDPTSLETRVLNLFTFLCGLQLGESPGADAQMRESLDELEQNYPELLHPQVLELRSVALEALERPLEAAALRQRLDDMGYQELGLSCQR